MIACDNAFWDFSLAVYAKPGVAAECLALQESSDVDVNILLCCAWLGATGKLLQEEDVVRLTAKVARWQDTVIRPLRAVRVSMKSLSELSNQACADLRKDVAASELRAEQIEQALLFESAETIGRTASDPQKAIENNVTAYLRRSSSSEPIALPKCLIAASREFQAPA